jgi:hypothetical protein
MTTDKKGMHYKTPSGRLVRLGVYNRLLAFKPILEQANKERLTRGDAASRLIYGGVPVSEATAYKYVQLLGIKWHHRQDYRAKVDREKLRQLVPPLFKQGLTFYQIAVKVGCSNCTVARFIREEGLVEDGKRYVAPLSKRRKKKEAAV